MLAQFYRFIVVNNSGKDLTFNANGRINLKVTAWFITPSTGKVAYTQLADDDLGFIAGGVLANGAEIVGDNEIDNTSNLYVALQVRLVITHDEGALADGPFDVRIAESNTTGNTQDQDSGYISAEVNGVPLIGNLAWPGPALTADDDEIHSAIMPVE